MAKNEVRGAHMLTKKYLCAWADERNRVDVIDLGRNYGYPSSVNRATVRNYAYEPNVLTHNLEDEYSGIEGKGIRAINTLRTEDPTVDGETLTAIIAFMDMYLDRGRYADQMEIHTPAVRFKMDGTFEEIELNVADRLLLSQSTDDVIRLKTLGLTSGEWEWQIIHGEFITGDGAVLLFRDNESADVCTIAFPLSPTQLLVIGKQFDRPAALNPAIASNSRRWLIGRPGTLRKGSLVPVEDVEDVLTDDPTPASKN